MRDWLGLVLITALVGGGAGPAGGAEPEGRNPAIARTDGTAAAAQPRPAAEGGAAAAGPEDLTWLRSETGRDVPDPTGTRFFRPAVSGGTGPTL